MAQQTPSRLDNLRTLRFVNLDGAFITVFINLVGGAFLVGLIRKLGGSDLWLGIYAAIPSLSGIFQVPGAILGRSKSSYKAYIRPGGLSWRLLYIPIIFLPFLPISDEIRLGTFCLCMTAGSICVSMVNPVYNDWLGVMVPPKSRGFFFSRRNALLTGVGAFSGLLGGVLLDLFRSNGLETPGYVVIFTVAIIFAMISQYFFDQMTDLKREEVIPANLRHAAHDLKQPFADRRFRKILLFMGVFFLGQSFSGNFFTAYALESLKMPFTYLQAFGLMQALGTVVASKPWGYLTDKYGTKPMLAIGALGIGFTPTMWLFTYPGQMAHNLMLLLPFHFIIGMVWAGVNLCQFNILLATSPPNVRSTYLGAGMATQSVMSGIGPLLGASAMTAFRSSFPAEIAYKNVFLVTMALRIIASFFMKGVWEEGASTVGEALKDLSTVTPKGYRAMRMLHRSANLDTRAEAMRQAASAHYALATEEFEKALSDPAPRVRREAAAALARMGDPRSEKSLIRQLEEHPDLVEEETVEALGVIGGDAAVSVLARYLQSPRSQVRRAAAKALGRIGSHDAVEALVAVASDPADVELRRASLQALRGIGAREAADTFLNALHDPQPSVRTAAAEGVSEMKLWQAAEELRRVLSEGSGETSGELAYALGAVGNDADIPLILKTAESMASAIARRRCLLGVAKVLGVEPDAYRLILLDGMARDTALLEMLRPISRKRPKIQAALARYTAGDERGALEALAKGSMQPALNVLATHTVPELFLVAVCFAARHAGN